MNNTRIVPRTWDVIDRTIRIAVTGNNPIWWIPRDETPADEYPGWVKEWVRRARQG